MFLKTLKVLRLRRWRHDATRRNRQTAIRIMIDKHIGKANFGLQLQAGVDKMLFCTFSIILIKCTKSRDLSFVLFLCCAQNYYHVKFEIFIIKLKPYKK